MIECHGIDLGTTYSAVGRNAQIEKDRATIIKSSNSEETIPSIIYFGTNGVVKIGKSAKKMLLTDPLNVYFDLKRFMGHTYVSPNNIILSLHYKKIKK